MWLSMNPLLISDKTYLQSLSVLCSISHDSVTSQHLALGGTSVYTSAEANSLMVSNICVF